MVKLLQEPLVIIGLRANKNQLARNLKNRNIKGADTLHDSQDIYFMRLALEEAAKAFSVGEIPVGAVLTDGNGYIFSKTHNRKESLSDPTAHAEVLALREGAGRIRNWRLGGAILYVTKEPCIMCAGAIVSARINRLVYGCNDPKGGAVKSLYQILTDKRLNHQVEITSGILEEDCSALLKAFFKARR